MPSTATTVHNYLAALPADRREAISRVRDAINAQLPAGFEERMQYGMISWTVPESVLPAREVYNKLPLCMAGLASQKNYMSVHLVALYLDPKERAWFEAAYKKTGKKLDMGMGCVRFKTLDALPVELVGEAMSRITVERYVATYRRNREATKKPAGQKATKATPKKSTAKATKKPARTKR